LKYNKPLIGFFVGFLILLIYLGYKFFNNKQKLSQSLFTIARVENKKYYSKSGTGIDIVFYINEEMVKTEVINPDKCYNSIKKGSEMLVRYSKENPKIVEIIECYYNEIKHKKLIGQEYSVSWNK